MSEEEAQPEPESTELNSESEDKKNQTVIAQRTTTTFYEGPLPAPELMARYNEIIENGAERIMAMAEKQQLHRQHMESSVILGDIARANRGLVLGFILSLLALIGGMWLVALGQSLEGLALILVPVASLVGIFVYAQRTRRAQRAARSGPPVIPHKDAETKENQAVN